MLMSSSECSAYSQLGLITEALEIRFQLALEVHKRPDRAIQNRHDESGDLVSQQPTAKQIDTCV